MHKHWQELLPFYVNGQIAPEDRAALKAHLAGCSECQRALEEWQRVARTTQSAAAERAHELPPLSPVIRAQLQPSPTPRQALAAATRLIWIQRTVILREGFVPALLLVLLLGLLATAGLGEQPPVALPLVGLVPIVAALAVAFLHGPDSDPAHEIVSAAPTNSAVLVFSRMTLVLVLVAGLSALGSVLLSLLGQATLGPLLASWFGPMLLLSALTTILTLLWRPAAAVSISLTLWAGLVALLGRELSGRPLVQVSLQPLLQPRWPLVVGQLVLAGLLWLLGWFILSHEIHTQPQEISLWHSS